MIVMDLDRLQQFRLLAARGHLRETAEVVGLSPSALSRAMKSLEDELGVKLFRTVGKRLVPTERARALLPLVERVGEQVAALRSAITATPSDEAPVRFSSHSVFTTYFLGHLLGHGFGGEGSSVRMIVRNLQPGAIERSVASGESDFGLSYLPVQVPGIELVPVTRVAMGSFLRRGAFRGVPFERIPCSVPVTQVVDSVPAVSTIDARPPDLGRIAARYQFDLLETALEASRQGLAWGYFPLFVVWLHNRQVLPEYQLEPLKTPSLTRRQPLQAFLVKRVAAEESPAMKRACQALRSVCKIAAAELRSGR